MPPARAPEAQEPVCEKVKRRAVHRVIDCPKCYAVARWLLKIVGRRRFLSIPARALFAALERICPDVGVL